MKRFTVLMLTALALGSSVADAGRRSGGGFGGSRSSSGSTYRAPSSSSSGSYSTPRYTPPRNNSSSSTYTAPRPNTAPSTTTAPSTNTYPRTNTTRTPSSTQRTTSYPSTNSVRNNPLNRAAASKVTAAQLSGWNKVNLPAGVPRSAITYSATPSSQYRYQLQPGRYFPYPQSYYRQHSIGYDILKYALIFTAVSSIADAMTPDVVVNNVNTTPTQGDLSDLRPGAQVTVQQSGPNLWTYAGVGFLAAAAAWFVTGRRRRQ